MSDQLLLVGTTKGLFLYRANASRADWSMSGPHLAGWEVTTANLVGPPGRRTILAGTAHYAYGATFRASDDLGATWRQVEHGPAYAAETGFKLNRIWQLVPHPRDPATLYAGVDEAGLFVSRDGGARWAEVDSLTKLPSRPKWFPGGGGLCLHTIVVDHANPDRVWVGISAVGCFRSDDAGATWTPRNAGLPGLPTGSDDVNATHCVHKIAQHPSRPDTLYMQYHGGVLRSDDGADRWHRIEHGLPGNFGFPMVVTRRGEICVAPLESEETRVFKNGQFAIYRSTDDGATWHASTAGLPAGPSFVGVLRDAMATDDRPADPGVYFGTTMGQVYASPDGGASWQRLPGDLPRVLSVKACRAEA